MSSVNHSVIIVGGGVVGLATAFHLVKQGIKKVLILEQYPLPHAQGSSHGHSRIFRFAIEDLAYVKLFPEAYKMWHQLECETGMPMIIKTKFIALDSPDSLIINAFENVLSRIGIHSERLNPNDIMKLYPNYPYRTEQVGLLDKTGGIMPADKVLRVLSKLVTEYGGEIHEREEVTSIEPRNVYTTIITNQSKYSTRSVVIAAGAWTAKVVKPLGLNLPIKNTRIAITYWKEKNKGTHTSDVFPPFVDYHNDDVIYGTPSFEYPGHVKLRTNHRQPDDSEENENEEDVIKRLCQYVRQHLPSLEWASPSIVEYCLISNAPDHHFIVDSHPYWKNIIIGVGASGSGFSLSIVMGKMLADLALGANPSYDISSFSMNRFQSVPRTSNISEFTIVQRVGSVRSSSQWKRPNKGRITRELMN